jgi:hypothetical protein
MSGSDFDHNENQDEQHVKFEQGELDEFHHSAHKNKLKFEVVKSSNKGTKRTVNKLQESKALQKIQEIYMKT